MNTSPSSPLWQARLKLFLRRAAAWLWNYFALSSPLTWPPILGFGARAPARPPDWQTRGGNTRPGISHFYLGTLAGCFITYFMLGGEMSGEGVLTAADYQSLAGIILALLLYPAVHRLGRFDDLRSISGSLLVSGMFGFIVPLLVRILGG